MGKSDPKIFLVTNEDPLTGRNPDISQLDLKLEHTEAAMAGKS